LEYAIVAIGLAVFGVLYALRIALRPFPPRLTWLEVVIGDGITDIGMSVVLWLLTHDWRVCLVPWVAHGLTGLPMIGFQVLKHRLNADSSSALAKLLQR
jgi:hypothetical protein